MIDTVCGLACGCAGIVYRAVVVGADGEGGAYALAVDHKSGSGGGAGGYRLGVGVAGGGVDLPEVAALYGFGPLLARLAPSILDLHQLGMGGDLVVDVGVYLGMEAGCVKALCGIRATGKYFPLARRRCAHHVSGPRGNNGR